MPEYLPLDIPEDGKLATNITWFARALRAAGLPVGSGRVLDAIRAVEAAGFTERRDFYHVLHACFVSRPEHRATFAQVFRLFWRDPRYLEHMIAALTPAIRGVQEDRKAKSAEKRAAEALLDGVNRDIEDAPESDEGTEIDIDASRTMSAKERLAGPIWWRCVTYRGPCRSIRGRCCISSTPLATRKAQAGRRCTPSRSARG